MEEELLILANAWVLACDPADSCGRKNLLVRDGLIVEIAESLTTVQAAAPRARLVDLTGKILLPGFVNTHFHGPSILLRELTEGRLFRDWSSDPLLQQIDRRMTDPGRRAVLGDLYRAIFACHLKSGTTTVSEYLPAVDGGGVEIVHQQADGAGIRAMVVLQNWDQVEYTRGRADLLPRSVLSLGGIEDLTVYTLDTRVQASRDLGIPLAAHWGETSQESEYFRKSFGKNMLELLREHDALFPTTQPIHLNYGTPADFRAAQGAGTTVILSPRSAAEKGTGLPALRNLRSYRGTLCLGTDWGSTDMMGEMKFLRQLPFLLPGLPGFTSLELLRMATIHGAGALGVAHERGSIEVGKRADLVILDPADLRASAFPEGGSASAVADFIVRRLDSRHIAGVLVGGTFRVQEGNLTDLLESELRQQLRRIWLDLLPVREGEYRREGLSGTASERRLPQSKIIPLVSVSREQSFEELSGEQTAVPRDVRTEIPPADRPPPPKVQKERGPGRLTPELPKNVKRVFGEEDDL